jgi:hypothetical protein
MERSTRFLSLSGLSGVLVGFYALAAATAATVYTAQNGYAVTSYHLLAFLPDGDTNNAFIRYHAWLASGLLVLSLATSFVMARRAAGRQGLPWWDHTARRLAVNLFIPLLAGGLFLLALLQRLQFGLLAPAMLLFYGLALVNASKYSFDELRALGLLQMAAGLLAAFVPDWGLLCWAFGFGVLHIAYGSIMYFRYKQ